MAIVRVVQYTLGGIQHVTVLDTTPEWHASISWDVQVMDVCSKCQ